MLMAAAHTRWTAEMVHELPDDGNRYEVVNGALLVSPAPPWPHQGAIQEMFLRLHPFITTHAIGAAIWAPADVEFDNHNMVEPDLFVVPRVEGRTPRSWQEAARLILTVEVLSPSSKRADRLVKRFLYQRHGVPEYWIIDLEARAVERWRPTDDRPAVLTERLKWQPEPTAPALDIDLVEYFGDVLGD